MDARDARRDSRRETDCSVGQQHMIEERRGVGGRGFGM